MKSNKMTLFLFTIMLCCVFVLSSLVFKTEVKAGEDIPVAHSLHNASVISDDTVLLPPKFDRSTSPVHTFSMGERITVIFCSEPYCMVERYYVEMKGSFIGWVFSSQVSIDETLSGDIDG